MPNSCVVLPWTANWKPLATVENVPLSAGPSAPKFTRPLSEPLWNRKPPDAEVAKCGSLPLP
jgi:hypothetical protein